MKINKKTLISASIFALPLLSMPIVHFAVDTTDNKPAVGIAPENQVISLYENDETIQEYPDGGGVPQNTDHPSEEEFQSTTVDSITIEQIPMENYVSKYKVTVVSPTAPAMSIVPSSLIGDSLDFYETQELFLHGAMQGKPLDFVNVGGNNGEAEFLNSGFDGGRFNLNGEIGGFQTYGGRTQFMPIKTNAVPDQKSGNEEYSSEIKEINEKSKSSSIHNSSTGYYHINADFRDAYMLGNNHIEKELEAPSGNHYNIFDGMQEPDNDGKITSNIQMNEGATAAFDVKYASIETAIENDYNGSKESFKLPDGTKQTLSWDQSVYQISNDKGTDGNAESPEFEPNVDSEGNEIPTLNPNASFEFSVDEDGYLQGKSYDAFYIPDGYAYSDEGERISSSYIIIENDINGDGEYTPIYDRNGNPLETTNPDGTKNTNIRAQLNNVNDFASEDGETIIMFPDYASGDFKETPAVRGGYKAMEDPQYIRYLDGFGDIDTYYEFDLMPPMHVIASIGGIVAVVVIGVNYKEIYRFTKKAFNKKNRA